MQTIETFSSLSAEKKQAIGLLSIGTFLEYFDLFLYVHMGVLLSDLFFPKTDPHIAALLAAVTFCSSYVFRPFGALIFGYIGDTLGRKSTVMITTMMMAFCCLTMANLPTYEQIGITAAYIMLLCRILQGVSSMGEIVGAKLYVTEITLPPIQYAAVGSIDIFASLGGTFALGVASLVTSFGFNWRVAFWFGALVAVVGIIARKRLKETPDFMEAKCKIKNTSKKLDDNLSTLNKRVSYDENVNKKTALCLFFIDCAWPACFAFAYLYCGTLLKTEFNFTSGAVIQHNFMVSITHLLSLSVLVYLGYKINPLKILKIKLFIFIGFIAVCPYLLANMTSPWQLLSIQAFMLAFGLSGMPAMPIFYKHFPVLKRFTYTAFTYALSRALMYVVTSIGAVWLSISLGHWTILVIMVPCILVFGYGLRHFEKLEQANQHLAYD